MVWLTRVNGLQHLQTTRGGYAVGSFCRDHDRFADVPSRITQTPRADLSPPRHLTKVHLRYPRVCDLQSLDRSVRAPFGRASDRRLILSYLPWPRASRFVPVASSITIEIWVADETYTDFGAVLWTNYMGVRAGIEPATLVRRRVLYQLSYHTNEWLK